MRSVRGTLIPFVLSSFCLQADEFDDLLDLSIQEILSVKVNSATLTDHSVDSTPAAITVLTRKEIQLMGVEYLHELLAFVPGYQTVRGMDYSYQYAVSSRSLRSGTLGREVLFLLDGRMVNSPRNGNQGALFMYPTNHIERLEVMRGPGAALYGTNAVTGVVNVITRQQDSELQLKLGSFNNKALNLYSTADFQGWQLDLNLSLEQNDGDKYKVPDTFSTNLIPTQDPFEQYLIDVKTTNQKSALRVLSRKIVADDFYNTGRISNEFNQSELSSWFVNLDHSFSWWTDTDTTTALSYLHLYSKNTNQSTPYGAFSAISLPVSDAPLFGFGEFESSAWHFTLRNDRRLNSGASVQFGLDLKLNELKQAHGHTNYDLIDVTTGSIPVRYYGNLDNYFALIEPAHLDAGSVYLQYQREFSSRWHVTAGMRYDSYSKFTDHLSPRLALIYSMPDHHKLKLMYGEAFRVPDFSEIGFKNTLAIRGNPDLKHEVVKTWNLIWLRSWHAGQIQFGIFSNQLVDPIENSQQGVFRTFINGESKTSSGLEVEVQTELSSNWIVKFGGRHMFERPESGFREARSTFSIQNNYRIDNINLNLSMLYNSSRQTFNTQDQLTSLSAYWQGYAKVSYELTPKWQLALSIKNLLNQTIEFPTNVNSLDVGIPARSRSWQLEIKHRF